MSVNTLAKNEVLSSLEHEEAYSSYIKTILGKVLVTVWDADLEKPAEVLLEGNPRNKDDGSIVKLWTAKEDSFFKRMNRKHFAAGRLIPYKMESVADEKKTVEQASDEELAKIVNLKYMALVAELNKITSVPVLFRMKGIAEDLEKSEKITSVIEKRISELQSAEYTQPKKFEPNKED
jgi:hypothetical protein